jgi:hypothetical protein
MVPLVVLTAKSARNFSGRAFYLAKRAGTADQQRAREAAMTWYQRRPWMCLLIFNDMKPSWTVSSQI